MTDNDIIILKARGKLMWPKLFAPDTKFEDRWTTDLLLNEEGLKHAAKNTLRVKTRDVYKDQFDGYDGSYLAITREVIDRRTGEDRNPPVVKDADIRDVSPDLGIGNGTDAIVRFIVKTRDMNGKDLSPAEALKKLNGYGMFLTGVQIINLVPYERSSDPDTDFVTEEGSFSADGGDSGFEVEQTDQPFDETGT